MASHTLTSSCTSTNSSSNREHGTRKGSIKVPCDDCIQNAIGATNGPSNRLCEVCMRHLHRPRRRQQQSANVGKIRRRSNAIIDTAPGLHPKSISLPWSEDSQVQHSLEFFIHLSAPQLAGYFDSPFWQQMLLQSGLQSPAVKHAIAAIGALHERLLTGADDQDLSQPRKSSFALEQCNQSIQYLTKPVDGRQPDLKLMLTTCILFTCFEAMQGHCEQAILHAKQGYALLNQYVTDPLSQPGEMGVFATELDQLCLVMRRLQTQSKGLRAKENFTVGEDFGVGGMPNPSYFETLRDARTSLVKMTNQLSIFFLDLDLSDDFYEMVRDSSGRCLPNTEWLEAWEKAFSQLLARQQAVLTPSERKGAMVLKAHHLVCEILSKVDFFEGALGWDKFHRSFTAIVDLAEALLEPSSQPTTNHSKESSNTPNPKLCLSLGILDPLYEVCARCRDPSLRRRALDLLTRRPRQECLWSSWSAWKVGKYLLHLEEEKSNTPPLGFGDADLDGDIPGVPFDFNKPPLSGQEGAGRSMYQCMSSRSPREALNPGLFAEYNGERLHQNADSAPETLEGDSDYAQRKPIPTVESLTELGSALLPLDSEMRYQSASLWP